MKSEKILVCYISPFRYLFSVILSNVSCIIAINMLTNTIYIAKIVIK